MSSWSERTLRTLRVIEPGSKALGWSAKVIEPCEEPPSSNTAEDRTPQ
jgi:hypothetical protein